MTHFIAVIDATFELPGTIVDAQGWILERLSFAKISQIQTTRWSDQVTNKPREYEHGNGVFYRYSTHATMSFDIDGGYDSAQRVIYLALMLNEDTSHMNIQQIQLSGAQ